MARQFEPKLAFGFEGDIAYELAHHGNGKAPSRWTVRVRDGAATRRARASTARRRSRSS